MSITHILTRNHQMQAFIGLLLSDCLVANLVNPRQASAPWLIIGYVLLGLTVLSLGALLARSLRLYGTTAELVGKRLLRYLAVAVIALIGLQSIGQLTVKDAAALLPLAMLTYLYFGYGKTANASQSG